MRQFTLVVVGKLHQTRFFPISAKDDHPVDPRTVLKADDKNFQAGLVIDHTVVFPHQFSFYLQRHDSPLGTAKSRHYAVIENKSGYDADEPQKVVRIEICFLTSFGFVV